MPGHSIISDVAFHAQGKLNEAAVSFQQALRLQPDFAEAFNNLGEVFRMQGSWRRPQATLSEPCRSTRTLPRHTIILERCGRSKTSWKRRPASYKQALRLKPDFAEALNNLGGVLKMQGKLAEAAASCKRALSFKPDFAEAHINLGNTLKVQGRFEEAINSYQQALRLKPGYAEAYNNLGGVFKDQGKFGEAIINFQQALHLRPDYAEAYSNLGDALQEQRKFEEAINSYQQALRLKPDYAEAYSNLGVALTVQGKLAEAIASFQQALALKPDNAQTHSNLIFSLPFNPDYDSAAIYREAQRWNDQHAQPLAKFIQPHANDRSADRRLRIGYVSSDFYHHVVSLFMIPLLAHHDHRQFEIFCYAHVTRPDAFTERLRGCADVWRNTLGLSDQGVADLVREDRIDILVDLTMHMANSSLLVFARKPAPVQVTWLAYAGTTGLSTMDYRLTDPYLDPPGLDDACYVEKSIRLPDTFWCYSPWIEETPVQSLPALQNGYFTLGCLNNFCKINERLLALWAKVLQALPQSRLLLFAPRGPCPAARIRQVRARWDCTPPRPVCRQAIDPGLLAGLQPH